MKGYRRGQTVNSTYRAVSNLVCFLIFSEMTQQNDWSTLSASGSEQWNIQVKKVVLLNFAAVVVARLG